MNYYERHLGDYARDTSHLSMLEHGAFTLLLDRYYSSEQPIPAAQAHRLARARTKEEQKAVDAVLDEFFKLIGDAWVNTRVEAEIAKKESKTKAARENGRNGGRPRKTHVAYENITQEKPTGFPLGYENTTQEKAHQSPDTSNQTPVTKEEGEPRKRSAHPVMPDGVDQQVWSDWIALRKAKRAPVTQTVIDGAMGEAAKAGMTLEDFLRVWCSRGSQGLEAAWLKPNERTATATRTQPQPKSFAQQEREAGWARWEQQTNRQHPDRLAYEARNGGGIVIDMQTATSQQSRISQ